MAIPTDKDKATIFLKLEDERYFYDDVKSEIT
jgi:hypothetical protein